MSSPHSLSKSKLNLFIAPILKSSETKPVIDTVGLPIENTFSSSEDTPSHITEVLAIYFPLLTFGVQGSKILTDLVPGTFTGSEIKETISLFVELKILTTPIQLFACLLPLFITSIENELELSFIKFGTKTFVLINASCPGILIFNLDITPT